MIMSIVAYSVKNVADQDGESSESELARISEQGECPPNVATKCVTPTYNIVSP